MAARWARSVVDLASALAVAAVYVATGRLGLTMQPVSGFATLVWPPSGISLAAVLLLGPRVWPGVALGAFITNAWEGATVPVACGLAAGNTLEALLAAAALRRVPGLRLSLTRVGDVVALALVAAGSTIVSATIGVACLTLGGVVPAARFAPTFWPWWAGDTLGDLLVAPLLLVWCARGPPPGPEPRRWLDGALAIVALALLCALVFAEPSTLPLHSAVRQPYLLVLPLAWAAVRFGARGAATASFALATCAIAATYAGHGPFVHGATVDNLLWLNTFLATVSITALALGAAADDLRVTAADNARLYDEAAASIRARDEFILIAAHELKTPLTSLKLATDRLLGAVRQGPAPSSDRLVATVATVGRAVSRLEQLVEHLLDISRISVGGMELHRSSVDLAAVARSALARFEALAHGTGSPITLRADGEVIGVWDRARLDEVVGSLLSNAVKYGGGRPVDVVVEADAGVARLRVRDQGIGIEAADRERIFERYTRLEPVTRYPGFGVGLWIVRRIVEAHGGRVAVDGRPGVGSTFTVELPRGLTPASPVVVAPEVDGPQRWA